MGRQFFVGNYLQVMWYSVGSRSVTKKKKKNALNYNKGCLAVKCKLRHMQRLDLWFLWAQEIIYIAEREREVPEW